MIVVSFVDANVLLYARDAFEPMKQSVAADLMNGLWELRSGRLSYQVLQEYYYNATRRLRPGLPEAIAREDVRALCRYGSRYRQMPRCLIWLGP
jgi:predicted nucleic acid-binding protein